MNQWDYNFSFYVGDYTVVAWLGKRVSTTEEAVNFYRQFMVRGVYAHSYTWPYRHLLPPGSFHFTINVTNSANGQEDIIELNRFLDAIGVVR